MTQTEQPTYQRLPDDELHDKMLSLSHWVMMGNTIERDLAFKDFHSAINFVCNVADLAERANHHPEICINYNKVQIRLTTHKVSGLTQKDIDLAGQIDRIT